MSFQKGKSGNPAGRPKNAKNKATAELRNRITALIEKQFETIEADFLQLDAEKRLTILERYLKYTLPPLQSFSVQAEIKTQLESLTDDQLSDLAEKITSQNFQP